MFVPTSRLRAALSVAGSFGFAALLSACSGSGSTPVAPAQIPAQSSSVANAAATTDATSEVDLGSLGVDARQSAAVQSIVTRASAYASPVQGASLRLLNFGSRSVIDRTGRSYPKDLTYYGGPIETTLSAVDIYVNSPASTWGTPSTFQSNLGASQMIHIADQYMKPSVITTNGRYSYAGSYSVTYTINGTLQDADIFNIVHSVAKTYGKTGNGTEYHVFLAPGVNECSTSAGGCYSPSNPSQWTYCAYHGDTTFSDIGDTLYTVEPYQNVSGCQINGSSPNGLLIDSTASTLSHETFETITDPYVAEASSYAAPLAWYNQTYGEIGDECAPAAGVRTITVTLNGKSYGIQPEYSNATHTCSSTT